MQRRIFGTMFRTLCMWPNAYFGGGQAPRGLALVGARRLELPVRFRAASPAAGRKSIRAWVVRACGDRAAAAERVEVCLLGQQPCESEVREDAPASQKLFPHGHVGLSREFPSVRPPMLRKASEQPIKTTPAEPTRRFQSRSRQEARFQSRSRVLQSLIRMFVAPEEQKRNESDTQIGIATSNVVFGQLWDAHCSPRA